MFPEVIVILIYSWMQFWFVRVPKHFRGFITYPFVVICLCVLLMQHELLIITIKVSIWDAVFVRTVSLQLMFIWLKGGLIKFIYWCNLICTECMVLNKHDGCEWWVGRDGGSSHVLFLGNMGAAITACFKVIWMESVMACFKVTVMEITGNSHGLFLRFCGWI